MRLTLATGAFVLLMLWLATPGYARTYANACPPADAACLALAERLEYVDALLVDANTTLGYIDESTFQTAENTGGGGGPSEISGTVALSADDRERMDLAWWGTWAIVGLLFVLILAPRWFRSFGVTHGG